MMKDSINTDINKENAYFRKLAVHKMSMELLMGTVIKDLRMRAKKHASSKSTGLEKELFSKHMNDHPNIWGIKSGAHPEPTEYRAALTTHAKNNDYVPDHFKHGISDMSITQLTEMICDIVVSAKEQLWSVDHLIAYLRSDFKERYPDIPQPIVDIICNSVPDLMREI